MLGAVVDLLLRRRFLQFIEQRVEQPDQLAAAANRECVVAGRNEYHGPPSWFRDLQGFEQSIDGRRIGSDVVSGEEIAGCCELQNCANLAGSEVPIPGDAPRILGPCRSRTEQLGSPFALQDRHVESTFTEEISAAVLSLQRELQVGGLGPGWLGDCDEADGQNKRWSKSRSVHRWSVVPNVRTAFGQQFPQHRSVATALVGAVAAYRKVCRVRQSGE